MGAEAEAFALEVQLPYDQGEEDNPDLRYTPAWMTEALLEACPPPPGLVLEPAAGDGAIVRVLRDHGYEVAAVEIRGEELPGLVRLCPTTIGDWLRVSRDPMTLLQACGGRRPRAIVTNVPFSIGREFAAACLSTGAAYVALLMRITVLAGSGPEWGRFWTKHPPTSLLTPWRRGKFQRPSNSTPETGTDFAGTPWFVWETGKPPIDLRVVE